MKKVSVFKTLRQMNIVDKSLSIFMIILLSQSAYSLFVDLGESVNGIDTVIRTTMAGIFGYMMSAKFAKNTVELKSTKMVSDKKIRPVFKETVNMKIGFTSEELEPVSDDTQTQNSEGVQNNAQVIVAAFIGLFSLITLIVLRNMTGLGVLSEDQVAPAVIISQFRDFVSGSIGFLIGYPTQDMK